MDAQWQWTRNIGAAVGAIDGQDGFDGSLLGSVYVITAVYRARLSYI